MRSLWVINWKLLVQYLSLFRHGKSRSCNLLMVVCPYTTSGGIAFHLIHILAIAQDRKMCRCSADLCSAALLWLRLIAPRTLVSSLGIRRCSGIIVMGPARYGRLVWPPVIVSGRGTGMRGHCCVPVQRGCCSLFHSLFIPLCLIALLYLPCQRAPYYTSPQTYPLENKTKQENIFSANDAHTLCVWIYSSLMSKGAAAVLGAFCTSSGAYEQKQKGVGPSFQGCWWTDPKSFLPHILGTRCILQTLTRASNYRGLSLRVITLVWLGQDPLSARTAPFHHSPLLSSPTPNKSSLWVRAAFKCTQRCAFPHLSMLRVA